MTDEYKKAIVDMQNKAAIKRLLNIAQYERLYNALGEMFSGDELKKSRKYVEVFKNEQVDYEKFLRIIDKLDN